MTAQIPEHLQSQHADFLHQRARDSIMIRGLPREWNLYGVIRGMPTVNNSGWGTANRPDPASGTTGNAYKTEPPKLPPRTTANWKGYTELYQLTDGGQLVLLGFQYDQKEEHQHLVNEVLEGDFFMVFKQAFMGPRLYVAFRDGVLATDRTTWLCELQYVPGQSAKKTSYQAFNRNAEWMPAWLAYQPRHF